MTDACLSTALIFGFFILLEFIAVLNARRFVKPVDERIDSLGGQGTPRFSRLKIVRLAGTVSIIIMAAVMLYFLNQGGCLA